MAVTIREATSAAEKLRALEIFNTVRPYDAVTPEDVARFEARAEAALDFLASLDGEEVGSATCHIQSEHPDAALALVDVLPHARRHGVGGALYAACSAFALNHGRRELFTYVAANDDTSLAFARRRGFVEQQRDEWLELDVATASPTAGMPDGVTIVRLGDHPELAAGMYDVACESLPDIPGEGDWTPPPRERWLAGLPPDAFVAVAAEEVVGYGIVRVRGDIGMHGITAVKRAWRRRGVARAIKNAQIAWAKQHGLTTLRTANEVRNEPMRKLNRALGYVPTRGRLVLRGPLS